MPAHPMWPENHPVWMGTKLDDGDTHVVGPFVDIKGEFESPLVSLKIDGPLLLIGQNIKFDILYLLKECVITVEQLASVKIWDTQLAEYLLSGQHSTYASLDDLAVKYGGTVKSGAMKDYWDKGIPTELIPPSEIIPYLEGDVENTYLVYTKQLQKVKEYGMMPLVESQMNALKATTIIEYNGMFVDMEYINSRKKDLGESLSELERAHYAAAIMCVPSDHYIWASPKAVSMLFFGGDVKEVRKEKVGVYKNGKDKFKNVEYTVHHNGLRLMPEHYGATPNKLGYYTVDDTVLKNIAKTLINPLAEQILQLREWSKQKETYYENMSKLVFPDSYLHPSLVHCATKTGRLSCNKPNIQNQTTEGGIKNAYVSRWGSSGKLVEFDYSQLEMVALAIVAKDKQLLSDIEGGVDTHSELFKSMYGRLPTKDERKNFKRLTFGLVYGAGKKTLAENAGCSVADAAKFIETFYNRYTGVYKFHQDIQDEAKSKRKMTTEVTPKKLPVGMFLKRMDTGRMYIFKEYDNDWKGGTSFSPTELKNWMVQGFATGDIVPHMVGRIVELISRSKIKDKALPIMTVHDSLLFDVHIDVLDKFTEVCYNVLSNTSSEISRHFSIDIPIELSVGCSVGDNWGDMKEVKVERTLV